jgi:ribosomal protein S18 acetylase RimI-like enzyme
MENEALDYADRISIRFVKAWEEEPIVELYRSAGWWSEDMDPSKLQELISGSYLFAVAIDTSTDRPIGMGRVLSDGIADAYIHDVVVLEQWRQRGVGKMVVSALLECCRSHGITWIGVIAQPGTEKLYRSLGFAPMDGHVPMVLQSSKGCR